MQQQGVLRPELPFLAVKSAHRHLQMVRSIIDRKSVVFAGDRKSALRDAISNSTNRSTIVGVVTLQRRKISVAQRHLLRDKARIQTELLC